MREIYSLGPGGQASQVGAETGAARIAPGTWRGGTGLVKLKPWMHCNAGDVGSIP